MADKEQGEKERSDFAVSSKSEPMTQQFFCSSQSGLRFKQKKARHQTIWKTSREAFSKNQREKGTLLQTHNCTTQLSLHVNIGNHMKPEIHRM